MLRTHKLRALLVVVVACHAILSAAAAPALPLSVRGNRLVTVASDGTEAPIQLHGVTGTGGNFECAQGRGLFDGPTSASYRAAMKTWNINAVRVPMNEDCLLGINGVRSEYGGATYLAAFKKYVHSLVADGFYPILTLHWSAPGTTLALGQSPMPDADHSAAFWKVLAQEFGTVGQVIFDLFNEPYPDNNTQDSLEAWQCWKSGGAACPDLLAKNFTAVGFDTLVATVRQQNASNVLMLGGINYANSLTRWTQFVPKDPLNRLAASWHSYGTNLCNTELCWELVIKPVMASFPVITGELGENDCRGVYINPLMSWLDAQNSSSYLAWVWEPWSCDQGPALITNYDGSCTETYGCDYKAHILTRP